MEKENNRFSLKKIGNNELIILFLSLSVICVIISVLSPVFLTETNIMNVLRQISMVAICGVGMCMVILLGEIDLSVGSSQAVIGVLSVWLMNKTDSVFVSITLGLAAGALIGLINGFLVTKLKIHSLIATLGMMSVLRGAVMIATDAVSIQLENPAFGVIGTGYIGPFPIPVLISIVLFAGAYYVLCHTAFGRQIYAVGGNKEAAKLAGLPVDRIKVMVYMISGMLTALSAIVLASRMSSGQPNAGVGFEMQVISAIILGGISLAGGSGTLAGAAIGMLILGVVSNGLTLLNVSSFYHEVVRGGVIILAVALDVRRKEQSMKKILKENKRSKS